jgi:hypothetical protein
LVRAVPVLAVHAAGVAGVTLVRRRCRRLGKSVLVLGVFENCQELGFQGMCIAC